MGEPDRRKSRKKQSDSVLSIGSFALRRVEPPEGKESSTPPPPDNLQEEKPEEKSEERPIPQSEDALDESEEAIAPLPPPPPPPEDLDVAPHEEEQSLDLDFQEDSVGEGMDSDPDEIPEPSEPDTQEPDEENLVEAPEDEALQEHPIPDEAPQPEPGEVSGPAAADGEPLVRTTKKPVVSRGETFNMCPICMGIIKQGLAMLVCHCHKVYHVSCGRRLTLCPNCESRFSDDMVVGEEEESREIEVDYESHEVPKLQLTPEDKLELLEERLILGEVSEQVYRELKAKYERERRLGSVPRGEELFRCPSCGSMVDRDADRCSCGAIFSGEVGFLCPECGRVIPFDSKACAHCGVRFSESGSFPCPSCGRMLDMGAAECACGTKFSDALVEGFNCPECGRFLESDAGVCDNCGVSFEQED